MPATSQSEQIAAGVLRWINRIVRVVLHSPFHALLSGNTLLLTIMGRKSGKQYTFPVSYIQDGDMLTCYTDSRWWTNLRGGAPVSVRVRGHERRGHATVIAGDQAQIARYLQAIFRRVPRDARFSGVRLDQHGQPTAADVARAARSLVIVRIQLQG